MPQSYFDPQLMESVASFGKMPMQMQQMKEQMDMNKLKMREGEANIEMHKQNVQTAIRIGLKHESEMFQQDLLNTIQSGGTDAVTTSENIKRLHERYPHMAPSIDFKTLKQNAKNGEISVDTISNKTTGEQHTITSMPDPTLQNPFNRKTSFEKKDKPMTDAGKSLYDEGIYNPTPQQVEERRQKLEKDALAQYKKQKDIDVASGKEIAAFTEGLKPPKDKTELSADAKMKAIEKWDTVIAKSNIIPTTKEAMIKQRNALAKDVNLPPYEETEELGILAKGANVLTEGLGLGTAFKPKTTGTVIPSKIDKSKLKFME